MCLIVHRPVGNKRKRGSHVPNAVIAQNARTNPDGFGIAWRDMTGGLRYEKFGPGALPFEAFQTRLKQIDADPRIEYVAHFRKATHGPACERLSHPFTYKDPKEGQVLVFHNGIISGLKIPAGESDTSAFVQFVMAQMPSRWWASKGARRVVEMAIGWSRILIMTAHETVRLNEEDWKAEGGLVYSTYPTWSSVPKSTGGWEDTGYRMSYPSMSGKGGSYTKGDLIGGDEDEDGPEEGDLLQIGDGIIVKDLVPVDTWFQNGHKIIPLSSDDDDEGDQYGTAICDVCRTIGEYYKIDGKVYLDVAHNYVGTGDGS